ncbi:hypothetical protein S23_59900 [Bradyrhizobium cosmicum]|uniref:Uncharacterized protein n=1 Tax=Bradyrhizobium cosmicum TaxID=1404864 RepID=A0AAI8QF70_9BRAD|nr:hypothetical protein S23_59900 [Bradyrhizobium cosmicum]
MSSQGGVWVNGGSLATRGNAKGATCALSATGGRPPKQNRENNPMHSSQAKAKAANSGRACGFYEFAFDTSGKTPA